MHKKVAFIYDFDGTLSPMNMQEYDFLQAVGVEDKNEFWRECRTLAVEQNANSVLCYMRLMLEKSRANHVPVTRQKFVNYGRSIELFSGVEEWFEKINEVGRLLGYEICHYINSSGMIEMIEGSPIARHFSAIYASSFMYDENGVAVWPATAVDFTTKTQVLWMINKGVERTADAANVNLPMSPEKRPIPFDHMFYFGDGETDVPSMSIIRRYGGRSFAVYNPEVDKKRKLAETLLSDGRVNHALAADYTEGSELYKIVVEELKNIHD